MSFNRSLTVRYNTNTSVLVAPIYIPNYACLDTHCCLEYCGVLPNDDAKLPPCTKSIHKGHSAFICLGVTCISVRTFVSVRVT
jgi:hypothetical protein